MVDDTDNEIESIKSNPINLEWTSTIRVKQKDAGREPLVIHLVDGSGDEIHADELDDMEEEEEVEAMEQLLGMPEDQ